MANSLSEGFARGTYTGLSGIHHFMIPVNFDGTPTPGTEPNLTTRDAASVAAEVGVTGFLNAYRENFNSATQFGLVELYTVDPVTEERQFIYGFDAATVGDGVGGNVELAMFTFTFKTNMGGVLRVVGMEGIHVPNGKYYPPYAGGSGIDVLGDYIVSDDSIVIGRDNAYAFSPMAFSVKYSDALRKRVGL